MKDRELKDSRALCDERFNTILDLRAEIDRLNSCLKFEENRAKRQGTHGPDCYTWGPEHYECAMREMGNLKKQYAMDMNFCGRCGKRNYPDTIHTCTPPVDYQD